MISVTARTRRNRIHESAAPAPGAAPMNVTPKMWAGRTSHHLRRCNQTEDQLHEDDGREQRQRDRAHDLRASSTVEPGDVLFFNGSLVHGSEPNRSDLFRRSLVGHYVEGDARECALWYHPALRLDGSTVELERGAGGGACGEWVERDGRRVIELTGVSVEPRTTE